MARETPLQTAGALLPGLQYLAREAHAAGLMDVAGIIGKAANDVIFWMHENKHQDQDNAFNLGDGHEDQRDLAS
jgi:hypothetical protein